MSFNELISMSRPVQISSSVISIGELLRKYKWLLLALQEHIDPRKGFTARDKIFKGYQQIKICAKGQDRLANTLKR